MSVFLFCLSIHLSAMFCFLGSGVVDGGGYQMSHAYFLPLFMREITFVTSCLCSCTSKPFGKGVYSKMEEFTPTGRTVCAYRGCKVFPFRIDPFSEGSRNNSDSFTYPESISISLLNPCHAEQIKMPRPLLIFSQ